MLPDKSKASSPNWHSSNRRFRWHLLAWAFLCVGGPARLNAQTPAVVTQPADRIGHFNAALHGTVNPNGGTDDVYFKVYTDTAASATVSTYKGAGPPRPSGMAVDAAGNLYLSTYFVPEIQKITVDGVVSILAGSGSNGYADGQGAAAMFNYPVAIALDSTGNIYAADLSNNRIRKVTPGGLVSTFAGSGSAAYADGTGASASFANPTGVAVDSSGNVYVADSGNHRIRKISPAGVVTTIAGSGSATYSDGPALTAGFVSPSQLALDAAGNLYVTDGGIRVRKISTNNTVSTLANTSGSYAALVGIAIDPLGNIYVSDFNANRILSVSAAGGVSVLAGGLGSGSADGAGASASFNGPDGMALTDAGILYVADQFNYLIRKIAVPSYTVVQRGLTGPSAIPEVLTLGDLMSGTNYNFQALAITGGTTTAGSILNFATTAPSLSAVTFKSSNAQSNFANVGDTVTLSFTASESIQPPTVHLGSLSTTVNGSNANWTATATVPAGAVQGKLSVSVNFVTNSGVIGPTTSSTTDGSSVTVDTAAPTLNLPANFTVAAAGLSGIAVTYQASAVDAGSGVASFTAVPASGANFPLGTTIVTATAVDNVGNTATGSFSVFVYNGAAAPTIGTVAPDGLTGSAATLHTTVNPNANLEDVFLQVSLDPALSTVVSTLAGSGNQAYADGTGALASFDIPAGVAVDAAGNVYVADNYNQRIRKISPAGVVTTLAGSGNPAFADGTGTAASFNYPTEVALDTAGNVYVADSGNNRIRKITAAGVVGTLAGSGASGASNGTGTAASFSSPEGVAVDSSGNVYVADTNNHLIRKITSAGVVTTLAGSGAAGSGNGTATAATFNFPGGVTVDGAGNVYVADTNNHLIRKITSAGVVSTLAGSGTAGFADGIGTAAAFNNPIGIALDSTGSILVGDLSNHRIRRILRGGFVTTMTLAGSGAEGYADGVGAFAGFNFPAGVTVDSSGTIYVADLNNNMIRKIVVPMPKLLASGLTGSSAVPLNLALSGLQPGTTYYYQVVVASGGGVILGPILSFTTVSLATVTTVASDGVGSANATLHGTVNPNGSSTDVSFLLSKDPNVGSTVTTLAGSGFGVVDGVGSAAAFELPAGVAVDNAGYVYVADYVDSRIRKIAPGGIVTTFAGSSVGFVDGVGGAAKFNSPNAVAVDASGNVYVADIGDGHIRKITPDGTVTTVTGAIGAASVAVDNSSGSLYVGALHGAILKVTSDGVTSLLAGSGTMGYLDGTGASAKFNQPRSVAVDGAGNVFVGDYANYRIRKITPAGVVTTIAGSGSSAYADGIGTAASFVAPVGIVVDSVGTIYVGDGPGARIRQITPAGVVSTLAGSGVSGNADGPGPSATFKFVQALALDGTGNLYAADVNGNRIRAVSIPRAIPVQSGIGGSSPVDFSTPVTGLDGGATYYFQAHALTPAGSSSGGTLNFTTGAAALTSVTIGSSNAQSNAAKVGDVITVSFTTNGGILPPAVTIAGQSAIVSGSQSTWSGRVTVAANATQGPVPFSVAVQNGPVAATTTDGSSVTIDTIAPALSPPATVSVTAPNSGGANVTYPSVNPTDGGTGVGSVIFSPPSGSHFTIGVSTVAVTVTDLAGNVATGRFTVLVHDGSLPLTTALAIWQDRYFATLSGPGAVNANPANDGISNLMKFALNLDPTVPGSLPFTLSLNGGTAICTYTRSDAALSDGMTFTVQWTDRLFPANWSSTGVVETVPSDNGTVQQVQAALPASPKARGRWARFVVVHP